MPAILSDHFPLAGVVAASGGDSLPSTVLDEAVLGCPPCRFVRMVKPPPAGRGSDEKKAMALRRQMADAVEDAKLSLKFDEIVVAKREESCVDACSALPGKCQTAALSLLNTNCTYSAMELGCRFCVPMEGVDMPAYDLTGIVRLASTLKSNLKLPREAPKDK